MKRVLLIALLPLITIAAACAGDPGDEAVDDGETLEGGEVRNRNEGSDSTGSTEDGKANAGEADEPTTGSLGTGDGTFTVRTETFVDETRSTSPEIPQRTLVTDIYVPGGEGPFPLVMHAHGMDGTSAKFSQLLSHWAEAGYVVVAPNFPRTNGDAPEELRDLADYLNQPGDVTFTLDRVLEMNEPGGELESRIAKDHMGISGLSLGVDFRSDWVGVVVSCGAGEHVEHPVEDFRVVGLGG